MDDGVYTRKVDHSPPPSVWSRHWCGLVRLDDIGYAATALADRDIARQVAAHKTAFLAAKGVAYAAAVAGDRQLVPSRALTDLIRADYKAMLSNGPSTIRRRRSNS